MEKKKQSFLQSGPGVFLLASLCNILWGSAIPFINLGYRSFAVASGDTATQILFAGLRFTLAGIITIIIRSIMLEHLAVPKKGGAHRVLLLALTQTMLQYFLFYIGVARTEAVKSSIIQGLNSFVAILVACFVFRTEKMTVRKMVGGLLGIAGILVVSLTGSGLSAKFSVGGEGALFLSMVAAATSSSLIKRFGREDDPMTLSGWQFMTGGLVMAVGGYLAGGRLRPVSPLAFPTLLYLALLSAVAYSIWAVLLSCNPVSRVAAYMVLQPIFGVLITMILTGGNSPVSPARIVIALALVSACIMLISSDREKG